jgi:hypothetical protein
MDRPRLSIGLALAVLALLGALTAWGAWGSGPPVAQAHLPGVEPSGGYAPAKAATPDHVTRYVATTGADAGGCTDPAHPCATVQYAVDQAAEGDEIHIATGVYTDVHQRAGITQTVYLSKTVALRGGYPADFTAPPDPAAHPTTLDARGKGRVLYITGAISPTVEGLRITGGNAAGLHGGPWANVDAGGGIYAITATVVIRNAQVFSNTAGSNYYGYSGHGGGLFLRENNNVALGKNTIFSNTAAIGGGLYLYRSPGVLNDNVVAANIANEGGGLFLYESAPTLSKNSVTTNTAGYGGGLFLWLSNATLTGNTIASNAAHLEGGGAYLLEGAAMLSSNMIATNTARDEGGGLCLDRSAATLNGNSITTNTTDYYGGGVSLSYSSATLNGNIITANTAGREGGGLWLQSGTPTLSGNIITANNANRGGGLSLWTGNATLVNNLVADNRADSLGSGLYLWGSSPRLWHTTIVCNRSGDGSGMYVTNLQLGVYSTVALTNTILVSHTVGITVTGGNTVIANGVLWYGTPITVSQAATATVTVRNQRWGDPAFLNPARAAHTDYAAGDYHIGPTSAAINAGVDAGVHWDIDGEPRPYQLPDLGADEYWPPGALKRLYLPLAFRS